MKECPYCHHNEITGAFFCSHCGSRLGVLNKLSYPPFVTSEPQPLPSELKHEPDKPPRVALEVLGAGKVLPVEMEGEATLGRYNDGQPLIPDIDLTPFGAQQAGVSRIHASIIMNINGIALVDLGSINGTFINGKKIEPNVDCPLKNGDIVSMADLKLQIIIEK